MADMPDQMIQDTYGEIPEEYDDLEKMLEEAGLSKADQPFRFTSVKAKRCSELELIERMIKDTYKEDMEERFVQLQMICQEQEEKLEWQEGRIKHLEKFLKLSDESVARLVQDARWQQEAMADAHRGAERLHVELRKMRANFRLVKATLKDLTNDQVDIRCATRLHQRGELANRINYRIRNGIARLIREAYDKVVAEDDDSGVSTPEQHPDDGAP